MSLEINSIDSLFNLANQAATEKQSLLPITVSEGVSEEASTSPISPEYIEELKLSLDLNEEELEEIDPSQLFGAIIHVAEEPKTEIEQLKIQELLNAIKTNIHERADELNIEIKEATKLNPYQNALETLNQQLDEQIEEVTVEISKLDLENEDGVEKILELSNKLENLKELAQTTEGKSMELAGLEKAFNKPRGKELVKEQIKIIEHNIQNIKKEAENPIKDEIVREVYELPVPLEKQARLKISPPDIKHELIETEIKPLNEHKIKQHDQAYDIEIKGSPQANKTESAETKIENKTILPGIKIEELEKSDEIEVNDYKLETESEVESKVSKGKNIKSNLELTIHKDEKVELELESNINDDVELQIRETESTVGKQASNKAIKVLKEPVQINKLPQTLYQEIAKVPKTKSENIKLALNPEGLGELELEISKDINNKVDIKMSVVNERGLNAIENRLQEIKVSLRARGYDTNIEVNKSQSSDTEFAQQNSSDSFNEARDEQKQKILNTVPEWLKAGENLIKQSFDNTLEEVLDG